MTKSNDYVGMRRERRHFSLTKQNIQDFDDNFLIQHSITTVFYIMCLVIEMNVKHFLQNIFRH